MYHVLKDVYLSFFTCIIFQFFYVVKGKYTCMKNLVIFLSSVTNNADILFLYVLCQISTPIVIQNVS